MGLFAVLWDKIQKNLNRLKKLCYLCVSTVLYVLQGNFYNMVFLCTFVSTVYTVFILNYILYHIQKP